MGPGFTSISPEIILNQKKQPETKNVNMYFFLLKFHVYVDVLNLFLQHIRKNKNKYLTLKRVSISAFRTPLL